MAARVETAALPADEALVKRLRERDEEAFELVLDAWSPGMLRVARGFVATRASAEEVVQEAWLAVVEGVGRFEYRSSLKTWVFQILVNLARRRGSQERRSIPWSSLPGAEDRGPTVDPALFQGPGEPFPGHWREFPAPWPGPATGPRPAKRRPEPAVAPVQQPEDHALSAELQDRLAVALEKLPPRQRVVITLRDLEGYESHEVSRILEISAGNQRVLLHRARAFVRGELAKYFAGGR